MKLSKHLFGLGLGLGIGLALVTCTVAAEKWTPDQVRNRTIVITLPYSVSFEKRRHLGHISMKQEPRDSQCPELCDF